MTETMKRLFEEKQQDQVADNQPKSSAVDLDAIKKLDHLNSAEAAAYCRRSRSTMEKLRHYGGGPKYIKVSARAVVYRKVDLDAWLASKLVSSTSEAA